MELWKLHLFQSLKLFFYVNILSIVIKTSNGKIVVKRPSAFQSNGHISYPNKQAGLEYIYHTTCTYNGATYATGEFHLSKCVTCFCNGTTGQVKCTTKSCPRIEHCVKYDAETSSSSEENCCPKCVEFGCYFNGTSYRAGEKIPNDSCTKCFCPWEAREKGGSKPKCLTMKCNEPRCVDSVVPQGKCCPICPNGSNCYLENQVITEGERIYVDKCRYCYCSSKEYAPHDTQRQAICERSFFCL